MNYIEKIFKKSGWIAIIESVIIALLGAVIIWKPEGTIKAISYILGSIFILTGIFKTINYISAKGKYDFYNYDLIYGLMACILGIVTIVYSNTIGTIFRVIIGIWIIYSSFIRMNLSLKLKALNLQVWVYSLILALVMFICGLYVAMNSGAVIITIGVIMIISSIIDIVEDIIFMRNVKDIF